MQRYKRFVLTGIIMYWGIFYYIWGVWGWNDAKLWSWWWWFDTFGHFLFGVGGAYTALFFLRNSKQGQMFFIGKILLSVTVISIIVTASVFWEVGEATRDFKYGGSYGYVRAQSDPLDNTIDIASAMFGSFIAVMLYIFYNAWYWKRHPAQHISSLVSSVQALYQDIDEQTQLHKKAIRKAYLRSLRKRLLHIREKF